ncbi:cupin domain-containing protein [Elizabethkingia anophelis]|uniref:hypothetical protein n=1 Tax=Elizabethkingia anophelis TaxID=1117645 RepID=UPI00162A177F|nr:hypothetical protein [Elizabethkingia anophelis]MCT4214553.1 hypothetical protein [Elizabethkingia anophelis]MCT4323380.1 hypothetical protein [Elizabethkingia anophelis]HAY3535754.1 cupin domain-containing protein [Elizabethkingia anophelis]HAY3547971.1 cupin domain-containing protein [Elizabethkingia anophelis]HAY3592780.1 cupin domain-containing protein [Elizabethkingia anophelis]
MELSKLIFPFPEENYLLDIFEKTEDNINIRCGTAFLKAGDVLPYKTLEYYEISYMLSGKAIVYNKNNEKAEMNSGDLIYIHKDEIRETVILEDSKILFFLFKTNL